MRVARVVLWLGIAGAAVLAGCAGGGGSGVGSPTPSGTGTSTATPTGTATTPTPTPTPSGPVYLDSFVTPSGGAEFTLGKCIGFTVVGNTVTLDSSMSVRVSGLGTVPGTWLDAHHYKVGAPATAGRCVFTPIFAATPGAWDVTVRTGGSDYALKGALVADPPRIFDVGTVGTARVFTAAVAGTSGANELETPYDVDVYRVDFADTAQRVFAEGDFYDQSGKALLPRVELWNTKWPDSPLGVGALGVVFPENGRNYLVVRDVEGKGGPGVTYDLGVVGNYLRLIPSHSGCGAAAPISPGGYRVDDSQLYDAMNPAGACSDSYFGDPIETPDVDAAFTVTVPVGKELRAFSYSAHYSQAIYLLPKISDSCVPQPSDCVLAAQHFGSGETNVIVYDNDTPSDQDFYLIYDTSALTTPPSDGAFMSGMELRDAP